ncbi:hypothetical protein ANN_18380 [Periplaneta americana]|uniref:Transposase n=1 Tax=Periplaneta americana TaxID=6978 RepID=A0ABQ8SNK7_PERAM|nr:hypothetical protein ANN_18380 [Periplaneta americana]
MLANKFMRTGSVADERRSGRPSTSQERVEAIRVAIERSPRASTRRLSRELAIPRATVWKVLHFTLKKKAYQRDHLMDNILFSDEATFHICGMVNRHNCRIWGNERPDDTFELQRDIPKVNVWVGITKQKVYGPFMFRNWRWIGRASPRLWAARSPDLTPMDFFSVGFRQRQCLQNESSEFGSFDTMDKRDMCYDQCGYVTQGVSEVFNNNGSRQHSSGGKHFCLLVREWLKHWFDSHLGSLFYLVGSFSEENPTARRMSAKWIWGTKWTPPSLPRDKEETSEVLCVERDIVYGRNMDTTTK